MLKVHHAADSSDARDAKFPARAAVPSTSNPPDVGALFRRVAGAMRSRFKAFIGQHVPECFSDGVKCRSCGDVHREGAMCPRQIYGHCLRCRSNRPLDLYGNCLTCGSRLIRDRFIELHDEEVMPER
jgi:hypothetical protein